MRKQKELERRRNAKAIKVSGSEDDTEDDTEDETEDDAEGDAEGDAESDADSDAAGDGEGGASDGDGGKPADKIRPTRKAAPKETANTNTNTKPKAKAKGASKQPQTRTKAATAPPVATASAGVVRGRAAKKESAPKRAKPRTYVSSEALPSTTHVSAGAEGKAQAVAMATDLVPATPSSEEEEPLTEEDAAKIRGLLARALERGGNVLLGGVFFLGFGRLTTRVEGPHVPHLHAAPSARAG